MRFQCRLWIEKKAAEKTITETKEMPREQHEKFKGFAEGARAAAATQSSRASLACFARRAGKFDRARSRLY